MALGEYPPRLTDRLHHWAELSRTASSWRSVTQAAAGGKSPTRNCWPRPGASPRRCWRAASRPSGRSSSCPAIDRSRAAGAWRALCRHPLLPDLAGLFAGLEGLRQACLSDEAVDARPGVRRRRRQFAAALGAMFPPKRRSRCRPGALPGRAVTMLADLLATPVHPALDAAHAGDRPRHDRQVPVHLRLDRQPKAVINTQRMMCANQEMMRESMPSCATRRRSWSTGCRGTTPSAATTISASRCSTAARSISTTASPCPAPSRRRVRNLREVAPTVYFNVPNGYDRCCPICATTMRCARISFIRLHAMFFCRRRAVAAVWDASTSSRCGDRASASLCSPASAPPRPPRSACAIPPPAAPAMSACPCPASK